MASLEKRYAGRYRIVFYRQGERRYYSLGKVSEREAEGRLNQLEESLRDVDRGKLDVPRTSTLVGFWCPVESSKESLYFRCHCASESCCHDTKPSTRPA